MESSKRILDFYYERTQFKYNNDKAERTRSEAEMIYDRIMTAVASTSEFDMDDSLSSIIRMLCSSTFMKYPTDDEEGKEELNDSLDKILGLESCLYKNKYNFDSITQYYLDASTLKNKSRQGHIYWNVQNDRIESIAEHVYGTLALALAIESEYPQNVNMDRVLEMLAIHETEEIIMGDQTEFDSPKESRLEEGNRCSAEVLKNLKKRRYYQSLLDEFNERKTPEAKFAYMIDKFEYLLQVKYYDENGCYDFENRPNNIVTNNIRVKEIIEKGASSVFEVHADYDEYRFQDDPLFKELFNQLKQYKINKQFVRILK